MITEHDLDEAIAECIGKRKPDANDCIKLAAFYIIKDNLYPAALRGAFSYASTASSDPVINAPGDSEFYDLINGKKQYDVLPVIDELMKTLSAIHPRLYNAVIRKLQ